MSVAAFITRTSADLRGETVRIAQKDAVEAVRCMDTIITALVELGSRNG